MSPKVGKINRERELCVKRLRAEKCHALADKIADCSSENPCSSSACSACRGEQRRESEIATKKLAATATAEEQLFLVTIAPPKRGLPLTHLAWFDPDSFGRHIKHALRNAPISWAVFGMDFSFNEHESGDFAPFFMPHVHGLVATTHPSGLKRSLRKAFPKTDCVPRPRKMDLWDGRKNAIEYMFKCGITRRISRNGVTKRHHRTGQERVCRHTRSARPRVREFVQFYILLDRIPMLSRQIFMRLQRCITKNGLEFRRHPGASKMPSHPGSGKRKRRAK